MTFQNKNMGGFRALKASEIEAVSGGGDDIIITGSTGSGGIDPLALAALAGGTYGGYLQTAALAATVDQAPVDENEDHIDDVTGDIIITAPVNSNEIARINTFVSLQLGLGGMITAAASVFIAAEVAALTTAQQAALAAAAAGTASAGSALDIEAKAALEVLKDVLFKNEMINVVYEKNGIPRAYM